MSKNEIKVGDTFYVIRYALTKGVMKRTAVQGSISAEDSSIFCMGWIFRENAKDLKRSYFRTEAEALDAAERLREKKIKALLRQADALAKRQIRVVDR